ncbi:hypothetical protein BJV78DRAFT_832963 [Lactifluus subvellereus]|nr:hypothetical protein BJV78DRAFT_832963 [Lactifluus subvellereus]
MQAAIAPAGTLPPPVPTETRPTVKSQPQAPPIPSALPGGLAEEARWGGDLIDVDADADDWNAFESAPAESSGPNAVAVGWGGAPDDEDPWGAFEDPAPPPAPIPVTELTSPLPPAGHPPPALTAPSARTLAVHVGRPPRVAALSPSASPRATPLASPAPSERAASPGASPAPSTGGMTKEEKAAEMARRKEERKQRIAQLKEQKKNAAGPKA